MILLLSLVPAYVRKNAPVCGQGYLSRLLFGEEQILLIYRSVFSFLRGMLVPCLGNPKKCLKH